MYTVTRYPHGTPCWAECNSTDPGNVKSFYANVLGWEVQDQPVSEGVVYTMFMKDGHNVAALSPMAPQMQAQCVPSHWLTFISVDAVDEVAGNVAALGGTVLLQPFDVMEEGRMAIVQDPTGAIFSLWQAKNNIGAGLVNTPGAMSWNELGTRDLDAAKAFYGQLLGWTFAGGGVPGYQVIQNNGRSSGGMMQMNEAWEDMPSTWMVYFSVESIEAALERVKANGGKVDTDIIQAPGGMRFAVVIDPAGAVCTLIESEQIDPWVES